MLSRKKIVITLLISLLFALPVWSILTGDTYILSFGSRILIYALAAVSLDLLLGYSGLVSLGHAAFVGIGAYVVGICQFHSSEMTPLLSWPFEIVGSANGLIVLPLAMIVAGVAALIIGALCLRTKGMHFIMITLAFAQMLFYFFVSLEKYGGDDGLSIDQRSTLPGLDLGSDLQFYLVCLACLLLYIFFASKMVQSRFGLIIRGSGNNERRITGLGIHAYSYKLVAFAISGTGAGLAGALLANQTEYISPGLMHWTLSGELMVMVLLGGLGTLFGPIIGAFTFLFLEETLAMYTEHWMVFMGPLLVIAVIFAKRGIWGILVGDKDKND